VHKALQNADHVLKGATCNLACQSVLFALKENTKVWYAFIYAGVELFSFIDALFHYAFVNVFFY
jgi:hypothetical protein